MLGSRKKLAIFTEADKDRTILVPWFSEFYSPLVPALGKLLGFKTVNMPPSDKLSIDFGLEYANNEICYPATLVVGDVIRALKSEEYKTDEIAIAISQTGGQCRATSYLSLIKRAMVNAGFEDVPVITVASSDSTFNEQPGFNPNWYKIIKPTFVGILLADSIARLYFATASREINRNDSKKLRDFYLNRAKELIENKETNKLLSLLKEAIKKFNAIPVSDKEIKTVGIVGEIYIKYNSFGHFKITDWLIENNIEVVLPPLMEFFVQSFVNTSARKDEYIEKNNRFEFLKKPVEWAANHYIVKFEKALKSFKFYRPVFSIKHSAKLASEILSLNNQYGEGWLIPAEIAAFANQNINHVICLQPFGCIANHIVGKGMEMKIKSLYPDVNLLYLDFDSGMSRVNILNRLHFLVQNITKKTEQEIDE